MSKRYISQSRIAEMETMLIKYSNGYTGLYNICMALSQKVSELETRINDLTNTSTTNILGDK